MTEEVYRRFHEAVSERGYSLVSSPAHYAEVTYFPNYYVKIRDSSPPAVWTDTPDTYLAWTLARRMGDGPFVLKDHVKSAKHLWHDACFVPEGSGRENFERVAENLKREQGSSFFRGFVVKQYVPLKSRGESPREYPMCEEYRLFFWKQQLLIASHYHRQPENPVNWAPFVVVDMGAGECSSLPPSLEPARFYRRLADMTNG